MSLDLLAIVRSYLERALREVPGMKVLLVDGETIRMVSTALSQSDILEHEVYLVERIDSDARGDQLFHLRAVAIVRPTRENVARLRRELRDPRFGSYHLCEWPQGRAGRQHQWRMQPGHACACTDWLCIAYYVHHQHTTPLGAPYLHGKRPSLLEFAPWMASLQPRSQPLILI